MRSRFFIPISWCMVAVQAFVAFVRDYSPAIPGFWLSVAIAIVITAVELKRPVKF